MKANVLARINTINREFYQKFADSFGQTRQRIQPGVARILKKIPDHGCWLDIGCGTGSLAVEWIRQGHSGMYLGVDFSRDLIDQARWRVLQKTILPDLEIRFVHADLTSADWLLHIPEHTWDGVMMFAVLHHIPGQEQRINFLKQVRRLMQTESYLYLSVWQLHNSTRLMKRLQLWSLVGVEENDLEKGDVLVDWRAGHSISPRSFGLRYVHMFREENLCALAYESGFTVSEVFYSDGNEGNLGLYQIWQAVN
jgi:tRNA (uracil-5-)-methyltransferase TRM9